MKKRKLLFLCTGNACRSQLAEAIVNARMGESWQAFSAGTRPAAEIHPYTLEALAEIGIHHSGQPKSVATFRGMEFDLVVTVCDAADEECPTWLGKGKKIHHSFPDPVLGGSLDDFRSVRDAISRELVPILDKFELEGV